MIEGDYIEDILVQRSTFTRILLRTINHCFCLVLEIKTQSDNLHNLFRSMLPTNYIVYAYIMITKRDFFC